MKRILIAASILTFLAACEDRRLEAGSDLVEEGVVVETLHLPSQSTTDVAPGLTTGGDLTVSVHTTTFPERWNVVIRCPHGKFVLDSQRHGIARGVWEDVAVGDRVRITYREVQEVVYEHRIEKSRRFVKFETTAVELAGK